MGGEKKWREVQQAMCEEGEKKKKGRSVEYFFS